jgi:hypothetical protein
MLLVKRKVSTRLLFLKYPSKRPFVFITVETSLSVLTFPKLNRISYHLKLRFRTKAYLQSDLTDLIVKLNVYALKRQKMFGKKYSSTAF